MASFQSPDIKEREFIMGLSFQNWLIIMERGSKIPSSSSYKNPVETWAYGTGLIISVVLPWLDWNIVSFTIRVK